MLLSVSSPARVEAGNHVFGECPHAARLLTGVGDDRLLPRVSLLISTGSSGTATSTGTMSTSASGSAAGYISLLIINIIYMLITFRSHMHISDVTNMLIIFFWIKSPLKLSKFLTPKTLASLLLSVLV